MGKLDIDYQVLHDAFFKYQTKPSLTGLGELYYEGKEFDLTVLRPPPPPPGGMQLIPQIFHIPELARSLVRCPATGAVKLLNDSALHCAQS